MTFRRSLTSKHGRPLTFMGADVELFLRDLVRFGRPRAFARLEHRDRIRDFILRQRQLAAVGVMEIAFFAATQSPLFAMLALLVFTTATRECQRMRKVGRYWQTERSMKVIGI